ncbi:MAG: hypothetical protein JSS41_02250 [Proteobacteria bacterium]|nr:hypothetical protein [Pseudomonadota bacterium]
MNAKTKKLLAPALSLTLLACAFTFDDTHIQWFWSAQPGVALALAAGAALLWALLIVSLRRRHDA